MASDTNDVIRRAAFWFEEDPDGFGPLLEQRQRRCGPEVPFRAAADGWLAVGIDPGRMASPKLTPRWSQRAPQLGRSVSS